MTRDNQVKSNLFSLKCSEYPNKNIRVNEDESLLLVNDSNRIRIILFKDGKPSSQEIKFDDYYKFRLLVEDIELLGNDKFLVALSDGSLNLHQINFPDMKVQSLARIFLNKGLSKSNSKNGAATERKFLQITSMTVSKDKKYVAISTNTDFEDESKLASLKIF